MLQSVVAVVRPWPPELVEADSEDPSFIKMLGVMEEKKVEGRFRELRFFLPCQPHTHTYLHGIHEVQYGSVSAHVEVYASSISLGSAEESSIERSLSYVVRVVSRAGWDIA